MVAPRYRAHVYQRDFALVRLPESAPVRSSFRFLKPREAPLNADSLITVAGYPGAGLCQDRMHTATGRVTRIEDGLITYDIVTNTGNSGGPVWIERNGEYVVIGIHVTGGQARFIDQKVLGTLHLDGE